MKTIKSIIFVVTVACFMSAVSVVSALANDNFNDATVISSLPYLDNISTVGATTAGDDPCACGGCPNGATVWYSFTPAADMWVQANTFGSDYDTVLSVWTGSLGNFFGVACNDDFQDLQSRVVFPVSAGQTYYFMVGAYGGGSGNSLVFTVEEFVYVPLTINATIDPNGTVVPKTGVVTVRGTVTCSTPVGVSVGGNLKQKVGRHVARGDFGTFVFCDGEAPWSVTFESGTGWIFGAGPADVSGGAFGCNEIECSGFDFTGRVLLKGSSGK